MTSRASSPSWTTWPTSGSPGIWLSPVTVSPDRDWGYDVADYCDIDPDFGTLDDLDTLVSEAGDRGIRILLDLVPNHTSDQHPWFVDARSGRDAAHRDWYVWADPAARRRPARTTGSASSAARPGSSTRPAASTSCTTSRPQQPDLNWWSEDVRGAFDDIVRFWWDRGVPASASTSAT